MQVQGVAGKPAAIVTVALKKLTREQIEQIDRMLASLTDFGEVRLIVQHGELRYINRVESQKAWDARDEK